MEVQELRSLASNGTLTTANGNSSNGAIFNDVELMSRKSDTNGRPLFDVECLRNDKRQTHGYIK